MKKIIPIKDLRNTNEISKMCKETNEPIHVTKNGYSDLVIMSHSCYKRGLKEMVPIDPITFNDDEFDDDAIEYNKTTMQNIETLKTKYHCNNDNTIILLCDCDDDEYLLLNFETNDKIIMQNVDIEYVNNEFTNNALYEILYELFTNEYCCM